MEKKKTVGIVLGTVLVLILLAAMAALFFQLGFKKARKTSSDFSSMSLRDGMLVAEKEKQPKLITGTVRSVSGDKMTVKQFANFDIGYEIKKEDVESIVYLRKNPDFDPIKLEEKQKEIQEKLKQEGIDINSLAESQKENNIELSEEMKALQNDSSLQETIKKNLDWNEIPKGEQVSVKTLENGKREITVYSKEFNIGPPEKPGAPINPKQ